MIKDLEIQNFKSIKHLTLDCKKINIFIGEPNTGKSNILESLGVFCFGFGAPKDFVRFENMSNLFYDNDLSEVIRIKTGEIILEIKFERSIFKGTCEKASFGFEYDYEGKGVHRGIVESIMFYKFTKRENFPVKLGNYLLSPSGENLLLILMTNKELKSIVSQIFTQYGLRLMFKPQEDKIEVVKQQDDVLISYPYSLTSETLQRIIFYLVAINFNKNSILVFEEIESHTFPYYTKFLAEEIAMDENNNQYFISTHNPYFLLSILEKTNKEEIGIFITYFQDYQTKVKSLNEKDIEEIMDMGIDVFFNIDRFLEVEK